MPSELLRREQKEKNQYLSLCHHATQLRPHSAIRRDGI
jgi:hypothetical protein